MLEALLGCGQEQGPAMSRLAPTLLLLICDWPVNSLNLPMSLDHCTGSMTTAAPSMLLGIVTGSMTLYIWYNFQLKELTEQDR